MNELRELITQHATAFNAARALATTQYTDEQRSQAWDKEHQADYKMGQAAQAIGVNLIGYVNPQIELMVLS